MKRHELSRTHPISTIKATTLHLVTNIHEHIRTHPCALIETRTNPIPNEFVFDLIDNVICFYYNYLFFT